MASRELEQIRSAILDQRYTLTEHAYNELAEDNLDVLDIESAILTGDIDQVLTKDPRGTRYTVNPDFSVIFRGFRVASASGEWRVEKR